jgi:thiosulfate/3-mercaptopyruvate sulfurtransferase
VRIVDARSAEEYEKGHIAGAVFFDLAKLRTKDEAAFYLPLPDEFEELAGGLGIGKKTHVVIYDGRGGVLAARLWYSLDYYGHRKTSLLNGGWGTWTKEGRPVTTDKPAVSRAAFKANPRPQVLCTLDQMKSRITDSDTAILDARSTGEYMGTIAQAERAGHIPGAINLEWRNNLNEDGTFKSADDLRNMYERVGITKKKEVVTYCQSGARAAHALFALRLIDFDKGRNYYGSWQEWGNRADTPVRNPKEQP